MPNNKFKNLNVNFRDIMRLSVTDRASMVQDPQGMSILADFTAEQLASMFPRYYSEKLPSISTSLSRIVNGKVNRDGRDPTLQNTETPKEPAGKTSGSAREGGRSQQPATPGGRSQQPARPVGRSQQQSQQPSWMRNLEGVAPGISDPGAKAQLSREQKEVFEQLKEGTIAADDPRVAFMKDLSDTDLKSAGIQRISDASGKLVYNSTKIEVSDAEITARTRNQPAGSFTSIDERSSFIKREADRLGVNPEIALRVANSEGNSPPSSRRGGSIFGVNINAREKSYGAFQLNTMGGVGARFQKDTGLDPSDPKNEAATIKYALEVARREGWKQWYGAAKVGVGQWDGLDRATGKINIDYVKGSGNQIAEGATPDKIREQLEKEKESEGRANVAAKLLPKLPQGVDPKFAVQYERLSPGQKQKIHEAIDKLGNKDTAVGVQKFNELYVQNPNIVGRVTSSGFSVGNLPIPEEGQGNFNRHSGQDPYQKQKDIVTLQTPYGKINVTKDAALAYQGFFNDLKTAGAPIKTLGSFNIRRKQSAGSGHNPGKGYSEHSYGNAVDLDNATSLSREMRDWLKNPENAERFSRAKRDWGMKVPRGDEPHMEFGGRVSSSARERLIELQKKEQEAKDASGSSPQTPPRTATEILRPTPPEGTAPAAADAAKPAAPQGQPAPTSPQAPPAPANGQPQTPPVAATEIPTANQAFALGGETQATGPLTAYSIDKDKMRRDDTIVTDGRGAKFTMNADKESMKYNPDTGKVQIDNARGEARQKINASQLGPEATPEPPPPQVIQQEAAPPHVVQQPVPQEPQKNSFDTTTSLVDDIFKSPSFRRAISQTRFMKDSDSLDGHYDHGAY